MPRLTSRVGKGFWFVLALMTTIQLGIVSIIYMHPMEDYYSLFDRSTTSSRNLASKKSNFTLHTTRLSISFDVNTPNTELLTKSAELIAWIPSDRNYDRYKSFYLLNTSISQTQVNASDSIADECENSPLLCIRRSQGPLSHAFRELLLELDRNHEKFEEGQVKLGQGAGYPDCFSQYQYGDIVQFKRMLRKKIRYFMKNLPHNNKTYNSEPSSKTNLFLRQVTQSSSCSTANEPLASPARNENNSMTIVSVNSRRTKILTTHNLVERILDLAALKMVYYESVFNANQNYLSSFIQPHLPLLINQILSRLAIKLSKGVSSTSLSNALFFFGSNPTKCSAISQNFALQRKHIEQCEADNILKSIITKDFKPQLETYDSLDVKSAKGQHTAPTKCTEDWAGQGQLDFDEHSVSSLSSIDPETGNIAMAYEVQTQEEIEWFLTLHIENCPRKKRLRLKFKGAAKVTGIAFTRTRLIYTRLNDAYKFRITPELIQYCQSKPNATINSEIHGPRVTASWNVLISILALDHLDSTTHSSSILTIIFFLAPLKGSGLTYFTEIYNTQLIDQSSYDKISLEHTSNSHPNAFENASVPQYKLRRIISIRMLPYFGNESLSNSNNVQVSKAEAYEAFQKDDLPRIKDMLVVRRPHSSNISIMLILEGDSASLLYLSCNLKLTHCPYSNLIPITPQLDSSSKTLFSPSRLEMRDTALTKVLNQSAVYVLQADFNSFNNENPRLHEYYLHMDSVRESLGAIVAAQIVPFDLLYKRIQQIIDDFQSQYDYITLMMEEIQAKFVTKQTQVIVLGLLEHGDLVLFKAIHPISDCHGFCWLYELRILFRTFHSMEYLFGAVLVLCSIVLLVDEFVLHRRKLHNIN